VPGDRRALTPRHEGLQPSSCRRHSWTLRAPFRHRRRAEPAA
jgi:hypothetical protein